MKNQLQPVTPGRFDTYRATGQLDGYETGIYAANSCGESITLYSGPMRLTISPEACRELVAHLNAALEAQQNAGGADHE